MGGRFKLMKVGLLRKFEALQQKKGPTCHMNIIIIIHSYTHTRSLHNNCKNHCTIACFCLSHISKIFESFSFWPKAIAAPGYAHSSTHDASTQGGLTTKTGLLDNEII